MSYMWSSDIFVFLQILTKDSVTVFVDAIMYYKVVLMNGKYFYAGCFFHWYPPKSSKSSKYKKVNLGYVRCI